jgi:hypothetical protein
MLIAKIAIIIASGVWMTTINTVRTTGTIRLPSVTVGRIAGAAFAEAKAIITKRLMRAKENTLSILMALNPSHA